jgi:phosphoenolpyruvate synthase/pyruvate phosphate dikinase
MASFTLSLDSSEITLESAGGKGLNLSRLVVAGFPVPPGFILTTAAYHAYVEANDLSGAIAGAMVGLNAQDPQALQDASRIIRTRFSAGNMSSGLTEAIGAAYADLGRPPVAVRSSATAEDLPGYSFAGQQDTFLNIISEDALQHAVVECWSSLWTARAIGYRAHNGIEHHSVSLAVVIQEMVNSESAGVLFTANPLTGKRDETVIDAALGLGEALVSGQVEPDHYVVGAKGQILSKVLGAKSLAIHPQEGGGTIRVTRDAAERQAVSDQSIVELANLGRHAANLFGSPQDVEWAIEDGKLSLLQSRPITTLYPIPKDLPPEPLKILLSFGAFQGMLAPISPLGRDALKNAITGGAAIFGHQSTLETQTLLLDAGERLWVDISGLANNRLGRRLMLGALEYVEPATRAPLEGVVQSGELPSPGPIRPRTVLQLLPVFLRVVSRALRTLMRPEAQRDHLLYTFEDWLDRFKKKLAAAHDLSELLSLIRSGGHDAFDFVLPEFVPRFGMGMATYNMLTKLANTLSADAYDEKPDTRLMMRGLSHNATTEMDLTLWGTAQAIRADGKAMAHYLGTDIETLVAEYKAGQLPSTAQDAIQAFLSRYGLRGVGEIDMGSPRWEEDPSGLIQALQSYLRIDDPEMAPDAVFERGKQHAEAEIERLVEVLRRDSGGRVKARLARGAARRMRTLTGLRETPKFVIARLLGLMRKALLAEATILAEEGVLDRAEDVFMLHLAELEALAAGDERDWRALVVERRQKSELERMRQQVPRLLLSDGRTFYGGLQAAEEDGEMVLTGSPVSPGVVEGAVHVVFDPRDAQLAPGEILVCPGTDPAWTPLFLVAGGLVMEVGGMMTHGAVVAREYGIPAVVGLHEATRRLQNGQRVRVDGSSGQVRVLKDMIDS